ncbi:MAG: acetoacetate decarboxylase family protein [Candidatus Thorarchaeota archaeon]
MGLVRTKEDIEKRAKRFSEGYTLAETVMVNVMFTTTIETIERVLPPPLEPPDEPICNAYAAEFHKPDFCRPYNEAALFVGAKYKGVSGSYCLSMPVTHDIAMIGGRELYGYPKKIAEKIKVVRKGDSVSGICVRRGIPIIEIGAKLTEPFEDEPAGSPHFLLKSFANERGTGADANPQIVKQQSVLTWGKREIGEGAIRFGMSPHDPLHEIPVGKVLTALYTENTTIRMQPGEVLCEVNPEDITPYMWTKYDYDDWH